MSSTKRSVSASMWMPAMLLLMAIAPVVLSSGCQRKAVVGRRQAELQPTRSETSPFEVAVDFMNRLEKFQPARARDQILYNLRQWSREQKDSVDWFADPMFRRLPSEYKELVAVDRLRSSEFEPYDAYVLQEAVWLREVARRVSSQPLVDPYLAAWLRVAVQDGQLTADEADDLSLVYRFFDWTIRHIQLDPEREDKDIMGGEKELARRDNNTLRHIYYPWENLLYGHGDWLERSRVFILLARQLGIQVVMLSVDQDDETRSKAWLPAALIGEDLYLFDPLLGWPLPGKAEASIARLADLLDEPHLLRRVAPDAFRQRISAADLENLSAAIDATPAALSQRMKLIESRLTGDKKTVLTVTPTPLAVKLRTCRGINRVEIWTFSYQGHLFRKELDQHRSAGLALLRFLQKERRPFEQRGPVRQGRLLQFRGYFRGDDDDPGAVAYLMDCRIPEQALAEFDLELDALPPDSPFLKNLPEDPSLRRQVFAQRMRDGKALTIWSKHLATYWLGLIAFDKQEFKVAVDYFQRWILERRLESPWRQGAQYNLARAYEVIGLRDNDQTSIEQAIHYYEQDQATPQRAGNLLRARRLRNLSSGSPES